MRFSTGKAEPRKKKKTMGGGGGAGQKSVGFEIAERIYTD